MSRNQLTGPKLSRSAGVLLHLSSLPGPHGHGDLGIEARKLIDFLAQSGQLYWQMLPIHPLGPGDSPYSGVSAFAGSPLFISIDTLIGEGLLAKSALPKALPASSVDFERARNYRLPLLRRAFHAYQKRRRSYAKPLERLRQATRFWLDDYCLFMALRDHHQGSAWLNWPAELRTRKRAALHGARRTLAEAVEYYQFEQLMFDLQWRALRSHAHDRGVRLIGDIPIFVAHDSADVWANQASFQLDKHGRPTHVSGVPPDYFSADGQLWGTPLYDWRALKREQYRFWIERLRSLGERFDLIRLDHFIGFSRYWQIPAGAKTAKEGRWQPGPGLDLFQVAQRKLGALPFIAEDLGEVSPEVEALRDTLGLPGMRVLQFAFGNDPHNIFFPHNYVQRAVAYTGTHDNNTTVGWLDSASRNHVRAAHAYVGDEHARLDHQTLNWALIRAVYGSVAQLAIIPMQDLLGQGEDARMNVPGRATGNWSYRIASGALSKRLSKQLSTLSRTYGRAPPTPAKTT